MPRATASSSAFCALFWPESAASISSAQMSRIWTRLPKRRPAEFSVGAFSVSCSSGVGIVSQGGWGYLGEYTIPARFFLP